MATNMLKTSKHTYDRQDREIRENERKDEFTRSQMIATRQKYQNYPACRCE